MPAMGRGKWPRGKWIAIKRQKLKQWPGEGKNREQAIIDALLISIHKRIVADRLDAASRQSG